MSENGKSEMLRRLIGQRRNLGPIVITDSKRLAAHRTQPWRDLYDELAAMEPDAPDDESWWPDASTVTFSGDILADIDAALKVVR